MRTAVDIMGGDHAPAAILQGCFDAAPLLDPATDVVQLVGDSAVIEAALATSSLTPEQRGMYKVVHATQVVAMDEAPAQAIRSKPDSSIAVMCKLVAAGESDVAISAGNTGACVAGAQLRMRLLPGVSRPGIAVVLPTAFGPVVLCDAGANLTPKTKHFQQYALMAGAYYEALTGKPNPRVGLLSIGEEDAKGNSITKEANAVLRDEPAVNFIGNVEGKDLFRGAVDVVVCDGFTGNVVLKTAEGVAESMFKAVAQEAGQVDPAVAKVVGGILKKVYARFDWQEYGGAPLLGVGGYCLIAHGRSDAKAIKNAIRVGKQLCANKVNERIVASIAQCAQLSDD